MRLSTIRSRKIEASCMKHSTYSCDKRTELFRIKNYKLMKVVKKGCRYGKKPVKERERGMFIGRDVGQ